MPSRWATSSRGRRSRASRRTYRGRKSERGFRARSFCVRALRVSENIRRVDVVSHDVNDAGHCAERIPPPTLGSSHAIETPRSGTPRSQRCGDRHLRGPRPLTRRLERERTASSAHSEHRLRRRRGRCRSEKPRMISRAATRVRDFLLVHLGPLPALRFNLCLPEIRLQRSARTSVRTRERARRERAGSRSVFFPDPCAPTSPRVSARSV